MHLPTDEAAPASQFLLAPCPPVMNEAPVGEGREDPVEGRSAPQLNELVEPVADADDREAMLRDPEVRRAIEKVARKCARSEDVDDVVNRTLLDGYNSPTLPKDADRRIEVLLGITRHKATDVLRESYRWNRPFDRGEEVSADAPQPPQASVADLVAHRQVLSKAAAQVPAEQHPMLEIYFRKITGESVARMAREHGIKYDTLVKRLNVFSEAMQGRLGALGALLAVLAVCGIAYRYWPGPDAPIGPEGRLSHRVDPALSTQRPNPKPERDKIAEARQLREEAFQACMQDNWASCQMSLDIAADWDPAGESDPRVQAAHKDANEGVAHLKVRGNWNPPKVRLYAPEATPQDSPQ